MRQRLLFASVVVFLAALGLAFLTHGTGVVRGDPERSISIPTELTMPLQVMAAHNDSRMFLSTPEQNPASGRRKIRPSWVRVEMHGGWRPVSRALQVAGG
jgi:hypothetical protein